jgi:hypothetical protein
MPSAYTNSTVEPTPTLPVVLTQSRIDSGGPVRGGDDAADPYRERPANPLPPTADSGLERHRQRQLERAEHRGGQGDERGGDRLRLL